MFEWLFAGCQDECRLLFNMVNKTQLVPLQVCRVGMAAIIDTQAVGEFV
jgi:hypothetical protein